MPVAGGSGGSGGKKGGKVRGSQQVVTHNPVAAGSTGAVAASSTAPSGGGTRSGGAPAVLGAPKGGKTGGMSAASSASTSASSSTNAYLAAQNKASRKARDRYIEDAQRLGGQVDALRAALGQDGEFKKALKTKIGNLDQVLKQQLKQLEKGYAEREGSLAQDEQNNEMAAGDTSSRNDANRGRERASALAEIAAQGGGESDALRAQLMSLRSWSNNQAETNQAYTDGARSIQNSRIDLVSDTRTAMQNVWLEADADRAQLWNDYHGQQSESLTALGNALGQQAEYYGMAKEQGGKRVKVKGSSSSTSSSSTSSDYDKGGKGPKRGLGVRSDRPTAGSLNTPKGPKQYGSGLGGTRFQEGGGVRGGRNGGSQNLGELMSEAEQGSDRAFMKATRQIGMAYDSNGLPKNLRQWGPEVPDPEPLPNSLLQSARTVQVQKAPEGATLRKW